MSFSCFMFKSKILFGRLIMLAGRMLRPASPDSRPVVFLAALSNGVGDMIFWQPYTARLREFYPPNKFRLVLFTQLDLQPDDFYVDEVAKTGTRAELLRTLFHFCRDPEILLSIAVNTVDLQNTMSFYRPQKPALIMYPARQSTAPDVRFPHDHTVCCVERQIQNRYARFLSAVTGKNELPLWPDQFHLTDTQSPVSGPYILFCTGACDKQRCWEPEKFTRLADLVFERYHLPILFSGTRQEHSVIDSIIHSCRHKDDMRNIAGKFPLTTFFSVVKSASLVISNDTGTAHIAGVLRVPAIVLLGMGDFGSFFPYSDRFRDRTRTTTLYWKECPCLNCGWTHAPCRNEQPANAPYRCISHISLQEVVNALPTQISRGGHV